MQSATADSFTTNVTDAMSGMTSSTTSDSPETAAPTGANGDDANGTNDVAVDDAAASVEEVQGVIAELETYRQRLVDDTMDLARKLKLPKKAALAKVDNHPEIAKIDQILQGLRDRLDNNSEA